MACGRRRAAPSHGEEESWAACGGRKTIPDGVSVPQPQGRGASTSPLWVTRTLQRPFFEARAHCFDTMHSSRQRWQIQLPAEHGLGSQGKDRGDFSQKSVILPELELYAIMTDFK